MRKKWIAMLAVIAVMAVVLSVTAMAADATTEMTNYGLLTVMFEKLTLGVKAFFNVIEKIYLLFNGASA